MISRINTIKNRKSFSGSQDCMGVSLRLEYFKQISTLLSHYIVHTQLLLPDLQCEPEAYMKRVILRGTSIVQIQTKRKSTIRYMHVQPRGIGDSIANLAANLNSPP